MIKLYTPELKPVKFVVPTIGVPAIVQLYEYDGKPPLTSTLIKPSVPPLQLTKPISWLILISEGWNMVIVSELVKQEVDETAWT